MKKGQRSDLLSCLFHLPGLQLFKIGHLLRKTFAAKDDLGKIKKFRKRIQQFIDNNKSFMIDDEWTWPKIQQAFSGLLAHVSKLKKKRKNCHINRVGREGQKFQNKSPDAAK